MSKAAGATSSPRSSRGRRKPSAAQPSGGVGVDVVATMCNLSSRRVQQLVKEGIIPRAERGKYNLAACVRAYITYLQHKIDEAHADAIRPRESALAEERAGKLRAERELAELRIARARSETMSVATAAAEIRKYQESVRAVLVGARSRYAERIPAAQLLPLISDLLEDLRRSAERHADEDAAA